MKHWKTYYLMFIVHNQHNHCMPRLITVHHVGIMQVIILLVTVLHVPIYSI